MMKNYTIILILAISFLFTSCSKKDYSENEAIRGLWLEETELTDIEELYFIENDSLYYNTRSASRYTQLEKFAYSLNDAHTRLYLWPEDGSKRRTCKIQISEEGMKMAITGIHEEAPDLEQTFTKCITDF